MSDPSPGPRSRNFAHNPSSDGGIERSEDTNNAFGLVPLVIIRTTAPVWYAVNMEQNHPSGAKVSPKDVFLHLLAIATLYASAIAFSVLLFNYIDLAFPRELGNAYYARESMRDAIRFAVSTLIVVFPVFFFTSRSLRKSYEGDPSRINLAIRKWVSYFTMFLAGVIGIGWLVAVIYKFLDGDFTVAFLLKALVVFFVTSSVFFYYRSVTKGEEATAAIRYFAYFVAAIVLAAIVTAFFMVGSPQERRMTEEDNQRVSDLQNIQYQIGDYYRTKSKLPPALSDLNDPFRGVEVPKDPVTKKDYEYRVKGALAFELCATFNLPFDPDAENRYYSEAKPMDMYYGPAQSSWQHEAGRQCFNRNIDPDYFKNPSQPLI